jgi:nicotinate-nucleotide pyrophosphorylase (carboxylating)
MLKDNHIDFAGGITKAIEMSKQYLKDTGRYLDIMVEARDLDEINEILKSDGIYRILIDNFDYEDTKKAVKLIGNKCLTESSGNINETTVRHYAECGVNYISCGALTHSVHNMDLSLKAIK